MSLFRKGGDDGGGGRAHLPLTRGGLSDGRGGDAAGAGGAAAAQDARLGVVEQDSEAKPAAYLLLHKKERRHHRVGLGRGGGDDSSDRFARGAGRRRESAWRACVIVLHSGGKLRR